MLKHHVMQQDKLMILANAYKIGKIYGLANEGNFNEEKIPYLVHEMVRDRVLKPCENKIYVEEPYSTIFRYIQSASVLVIAEKFIPYSRREWFYLAEGIVHFEESHNDENALRISLIDSNEFVGYLEEEGYIPEEILDDEIAGIEDVGSVEENIDYCMKYAEFESIRLNVNGDIGKTRIIQTSHNYWMVDSKHSEEYSLKPYKKQSFIENLLKIWE